MRKQHFSHNLFGGESCSVRFGQYEYASYIPIPRSFHFSVSIKCQKNTSSPLLSFSIDCLEKCIHINNGPYQLIKKDPTTKIKAKTLEQQLKALKDIKLIDNKLHYILHCILLSKTYCLACAKILWTIQNAQTRSSYTSHCFI